MLEIKDLCFSPGGKEIIKHLDLTVPDGKLIIITGPNGGGKTTLAKLIAGLEKPDSGSITFNGRDITGLDPTERALAGISYGFQQPVRFKGFTVRELLTIAKGGELSEEELARTLSLVGLDAESYADRALDSHLSGGEIKRIEIASVFLRDTELAIFDEPEAGIDLWSFNSLIRVFEDMRDTRKKTMIIISHQERIISIADDIVLIQDGKIVVEGPRRKIYPLICKQGCMVFDLNEIKAAGRGRRCEKCDRDGDCDSCPKKGGRNDR